MKNGRSRLFYRLLTGISLLGFMLWPGFSQIQKNQEGIRLFAGPRISGSFSIIVHPNNTRLLANITVFVNERPVESLKIRVHGSDFQESEPGKYRLILDPYQATPGKEILLIIQQPPTTTMKNSAVRGLNHEARATIKSLIQFTSPAPEAQIELKSAPEIRVSWLGSTAPVNCVVKEIRGSAEAGLEMLRKEAIISSHVLISTSLLQSARKYGIYVTEIMSAFVFDERLHPESRISLNQTVVTYFRTR